MKERSSKHAGGKTETSGGLVGGLNKELRNLYSLMELDLLIAQGMASKDIGWLVTTALTSMLEVPFAAICLKEGEDGNWLVIGQRDKRSLDVDSAQAIASLLAHDLANRTFSVIGSTLLADLQEASEAMPEPLAKLGLRSVLVMPIGTIASKFGVLMVGSEVVEDYTSEQRFLIASAANQVAVALENASLIRQAQESEQRYRELFENINDAVMVSNSEGRFIDCNEATLKRLGYSRQEFLQLKAGDVVHPDFHQLMQDNQKKIFSGEATIVKSAHRSKDGRVIPVEVNVCKIEYGGEPAILAVVRDITERKRAEEALRRTEENFRRSVDESPLGIRIATADSKTIYANQAILDVYGYDSLEDLKKTPLNKHFTPESWAEHQVRMEKRQRGEYTPSNYEISIVCKDGEIRHLLVSRRQVVWDGKTQSQAIYQDITERKRAEKALRESESEYRTLVDNLPQRIFLKDKDSVYVSCNENYARDLKITADEITGKTDYGFYPKKLAEKYRADDKRVMESGRTEEIEEKHIQDGQEVWVHTAKTPVKDKGGNTVGVLGIFWDVTERKEAEEKIRRAAEEWRTTFDSISDLVSMHDRDFKIVRVNRAFADAFKMKPKEVIGKACYQLVHGREASLPSCPHQKVLETGRPARVEFFEPRLGVHLEVSASPILDRDNRVIGTVHITKDITERRRAEESLKAQKELTDRILASTPNAVLVIGKDSRIVAANRAFCKIFRIEGGEVGGKPIADILRIAELSEAISKTFANVKPQLNLEFKYESDTGQRILAGQITPMHKEEEVLLILRDVTVERAMQGKLYHVGILATVGELAAGVAHELNNPLTSVLGFSEVLLRGELPEQAKDDVKVIHDSAERAAVVVKNLLTFARRHKPERTRVNINDILKQVLDMRSYQFKASNIGLVTELAPELPMTMADSQQLQQVVLNIVINAEQAMVEAHGRGTLTIRTEVAGDMIRVSFADDGPGIPRENLYRVFEPFFTTKPPGKGTGLGLSICHGIVTEHGGRTYAESKIGKGATFFVELPVSAGTE